MFTNRSSGVLLHPTSFPGPFGAGDLGDEAYRFIDWLHAANQKWWQILPLNPPWFDGSPYKSPGAFAGNPLIISPDRLIRDGLLMESDVAPFRRSVQHWADRIDFSTLATEKHRLHEAAFSQFESRGPGDALASQFEQFREQRASWLDPYSTFLSHRECNDNRPWLEWTHQSSPPSSNAQTWERRKRFFQFEQFLFYRQWADLRSYAAQKGIGIIGDLPIYVAYESADVWSEPEIFQLDESRRPTEVSGVPPDYFSATGQLWNNPIYNWQTIANTGFDWWIRRVHATLDLVDVARIDHFRGFAGYWSVPAGQTTAVHGRWVPGPASALFDAIRQSLATRTPAASIPLIAEDLGTITPDVVALRKQFDLPGMRVLQFEVLDGSDHAMHVEQYEPDTVVYTGTHDNDTTRGWFQSDVLPNEGRLNRLRQFVPGTMESIAWDMIDLAWRSTGVLAVAPLQDILSLDSVARMNTPGTTTAEQPNWQWRYSHNSLTPELAARLAELTSKHHRE